MTTCVECEDANTYLNYKHATLLDCYFHIALHMIVLKIKWTASMISDWLTGQPPAMLGHNHPLAVILITTFLLTDLQGNVFLCITFAVRMPPFLLQPGQFAFSFKLKECQVNRVPESMYVIRNKSPSSSSSMASSSPPPPSSSSAAAAPAAVAPAGASSSSLSESKFHFLFKKMCFKISSAKRRPFCPGGDELSMGCHGSAPAWSQVPSPG